MFFILYKFSICYHPPHHLPSWDENFLAPRGVKSISNGSTYLNKIHENFEKHVDRIGARE